VGWQPVSWRIRVPAARRLAEPLMEQAMSALADLAG